MSRFEPGGWLNRRRVKRTSTGVVVRITDDERALLANTLPQLRTLLLEVAPAGPLDQGLRRLFPTAHADDADADREFQESSRDRLLAARLDRLDVIEATLHAEELTFEQHEDWIVALNDVRLVLGTRLDVSEDDDPAEFNPEDPTSAQVAIYHYLGYLLGEFLDASEWA
jgi:DNA-binding MarR family transcriptional regulator